MRARGFVLGFFLCFLILACIGIVDACDYFLSTHGNDSNSGTSIDQAWRSLSYACSQLQAGDTLCIIDDGVYYDQYCYPADSGNATHPITIKAYNGTPTFVGNASTIFWDGLYHSMQDYWVIRDLRITGYQHGIATDGNGDEHLILENLEIWNTSGSGIYLTRGHEYATIRNCTIHSQPANKGCITIHGTNPTAPNKGIIIVNNNLTGCHHNAINIHTYAQDILIENNTITNSDNYAGISVHNSGCENITIRNNFIDNCTNGIQLIGVNDSLIEGNGINNSYATGSGYGIAITITDATTEDGCYNNIIRNNIITNSNGAGVQISVVENETVQNITFSNNVYYAAPYGIRIVGGGEVTEIFIKNSIFMNITNYCVDNQIGKNVVVNYNDVWNNSTAPFYNVTDNNTLHQDPLFTDPPDDFHLKSQIGRWNGSAWVKDNVTSPCIDEGDPEDDYSKEPEPNGDRINIGAYGNTKEASKSPESIVEAPANKWTSFRMHPSYNLTFEQISANLTNHQALSYYNKSIGLWQSYWVGYDFNKNVVVSERESLFAYFSAETNLSCDIPSPKVKPLKAEDTTPLYLRGYENKRIEEIKAALVADGCNVVQVCGWDKNNQEWNCTDDFVVHPSEGFIVQTSNDCIWREIV